MIIKHKKKSLSFILALLSVVILSSLTLNSKNIDGESIELMVIKGDFIEYLMTLNPGFSFRVNLVDSGEGIFLNRMSEGWDKYRRSIIPSFVKSIPEIVKYKIMGDDFERIDIDIKHIDYQKILKDRDNALKIKFLTNASTVNAKIRFRGKTFKSKLRLKGNTVGHWKSSYRMSFRIRLTGENTILGYKKFSSQKSQERHYPYDHAFQSMIKKMGNLSTVQNFVHLYVNGTDWGIMNLEEHMTKEYLEKLKRKESLIVRFANNKWWGYNYKDRHDSYLHYRISDPSLNISLYGSKKYLKNNHYRKVFSYISKNRLTNNPQLYEIDHLAKAYILATAWGSWHTLVSNNLRYYFNPYTLKLEPITTDQTAYKALNGFKNILFNQDKFNETQYDSFLAIEFPKVISTQKYKNNLSKNIKSVSNVVSGINSYLNSTSHLFPVDKKKNGALVIDNMKKIISNKKEYLVPLAEDFLGINKEQLILPTEIQASNFEEHLHIRHYMDGRLELYNLLPDDVTVKDILLDGKSFLNDPFVVPGYLSNPSPVSVPTKILGVQDKKVTVESEYQGFIRQNKNEITLIKNNIENPLLQDTPQGLKFLKKLEGKNYEFEKGNWVLNKPITIDGNLNITAGVNIKFSSNAYLIIKGALTAIGTKAQPIRLESSLDSWKGIYVLKADKKSHLNNIIIKNITALEDQLLKLTGGITFYKSDVDFQNVTIENVKAEDAINIVHSNYTMNSISIDNTVSDALDSDFSKGRISQSTFSNIGGDALDFSGSNAEIDEIKALNIRDKVISAGESSQLNIKNSHFNAVGVGIASKDGSEVFVTTTSVLDYQLHAVMSYIKKDFYGIPRVELVDCNIGLGDPYLRQKQTKMIVDKNDIPEKELNVKELYQGEVMQK